MDVETLAIARTAQRELGAKANTACRSLTSSWRRVRISIGAAVLHGDRQYDSLARVLAFTPVRLDA